MKCDFFISYHHWDQPWAEWIAWQLEQAGCTVSSHAWDLSPDSFLGLEIRKSMSLAGHTIAVLSAHDQQSDSGHAKWATALQQDPQFPQARLISVCVQQRDFPGILSTQNHVDLSDGNAEDCRRRLLQGAGIDSARWPDDQQAAWKRTLARWREKLAFLQQQLPNLDKLERKVIVSQSIDAAQQQIAKLQAACNVSVATLQHNLAVQALIPVFPRDLQECGLDDANATDETLAGSQFREQFPLVENETTLGRHPDCDVTVEIKTISRFHARITRTGEQYQLEDTNSQNGTHLNGQCLTEPEWLRDGDRICIGRKNDFIFHQDESGAYLTPADHLNIPAAPQTKLDALKRINVSLSNSLSLDQILPQVLENLFAIFPAADRGFVVLQDAEGEIAPRWIKQRRSGDQADSAGISRTVIRKVMESGQSMLSEDAVADSRFGSESVDKNSVRSLMCAPLCDHEGDAFGALQIDTTHGRGQFTAADIDLLSGVATQAGVVIDKARMLEQELLQRQVEQDLRMANEVRVAFLPKAPPQVTGYRFSNYYKPAPQMGGDFFDYLSLPGGCTAVVVADIVGHGISAAMYMAKLSSETRDCLTNEADPARAIERLNDRLVALQVDRFVTLLLLVVDPQSSKLTMVNAGHMPPIIRSATDGCTHQPGKQQSGLPLAINAGAQYQAVQFQFSDGDLAVMFTDGINEAMNVHDELFGTEPIRAAVAQGGHADQVNNRIADAVMDHIGNAPMTDDICLLVIERAEN